MKRISLDPPRKLNCGLAESVTWRRYDVVPAPPRAVAQNQPVPLSYGLFEMQVKRWKSSIMR